MTVKEKNPLDAVERLAGALSEAGAWAAAGDIDPSRLVVYGRSRGATIVRASLPLAVAGAAIAQGLAKWDEGQKRSLRLTAAGRAHARRAAAPEGAYLAQHASISVRPIENYGRAVAVNDSESPLAWLARRKDRDGRPFITPAQFEAGERFRRDITQAQILQRVTVSWEPPSGAARRGHDAGANVTDIALDARARVNRACEAVGPELVGLLTDVCGYLKGLETVESERGWPSRSGKVVLGIALDRLASHYGLSDVGRGPDRARSRHWGAEDYRPTIGA